MELAAPPPELPALELLFEPAGLPSYELPAALAAAYPGALGFDEPRVYANFVTTADGAVAIPAVPQSNKLIAAGSGADRFVMGLLRACADAVLLGSGTLAASPRGLWTPAQAYPDAAEAFAELRRARGLPPEPEITILSASGDVDPAHPVFAAGGLLLTTDRGQAHAAGRLPAGASVVSLGSGGVVDPTAALGALRARGHRLVLHEGGPHVIGSFLDAGTVDELFLTVSPLLTGRTLLTAPLALVEGTDLLPGVPMRLLGARREKDHLFLRYRIRSR